MWNRLRTSLPIQMVLAALLAWLTAFLLTSFLSEPRLQSALANGDFDTIFLAKTIYLGLLKMVVGIMVLFSLIEGISNIGSMVRLKNLGSKTLIFYTFTTTIAISLGLGASLLMPQWQPLAGHVALADNVTLIDSNDATGGAILTKMITMALVNPVAAIAQGNLLAIVVFALMFGTAILIALPKENALHEVISAINKVINTLVSGIVKLSPLAIFAIIFEISLTSNSQLFGQLALFALLVFVLTMIHGGIVLPLIAKLATGISPLTLFKAISAPMAMALATSSSAATLPLAMQSAEEELGVSPSVTSMVLPLGAVMNMDGTALFEGVAAIFLAQLFGVDLSTSGLVMIFIMAMVSSVGAPGMPSGSMSGMQLVLLAAGIPLEAIAILLIIERPLDTFRTAVNVEGDIIASLVVDKWQASTHKSATLETANLTIG
ncbi:dicarboxylate/amino acid:cation symporter [Vibrio sinensis]|uniref:Dicarboxylate/amino acid:cation symporter n=1 Tax=Vibrio sinensis TaxID=2302434 RepID=A0A3A6R2G0_9VIBR|nr:dicarboxylate/amino acid:cation symporter [Vibrio sinensis]RJX75317.1 dicarboxylate/amino acid:cation symporter [Vibrio sinensis]